MNDNRQNITQSRQNTKDKKQPNPNYHTYWMNGKFFHSTLMQTKNSTTATHTEKVTHKNLAENLCLGLIVA